MKKILTHYFFSLKDQVLERLKQRELEKKPHCIKTYIEIRKKYRNH